MATNGVTLEDISLVVDDILDIDEEDVNDVFMDDGVDTKDKFKVSLLAQIKSEALEPPVKSLRTVRDLYDRCENGEIDLSPVYQRDSVWNRDKQIELIDSLMKNYDIPPILLCTQPEDSEEEPDGPIVPHCLDGKQRLTSIRKFMSGQIPFINKVSKEHYYYHTSASTQQRGGTRLPEDVRKYFDSRKLMVTLYENITPEQEAFVFQRVQKGMPLSNAEKQFAIMPDGPRHKDCDWVARRYLLAPNTIASLTNMTIRRARGFQNVAYLTWSIDKLASQSQLSGTNWCSEDNVSFWLNNRQPIDGQVRNRVKKICKVFLAVVRHPTYGSYFKKGVGTDAALAPVEFVNLGILIHEFMSKLTAKDLAEAMRDIRKRMRDKYPKAMRHKSEIHEEMLSIIYNDIEASSAEEVVVASHDAEFMQRGSPPPMVTLPSGTVGPLRTPKRKREVQVKMEEGEEGEGSDAHKRARGSGDEEQDEDEV